MSHFRCGFNYKLVIQRFNMDRWTTALICFKRVKCVSSLLSLEKRNTQKKKKKAKKAKIRKVR